MTGKDNTVDFFMHLLRLYHGKLNNFEECFYKSALLNLKYTVQSNQRYVYFLKTALSASLNKYICGQVFISIASSWGFYRKYNYCTLPKNSILSQEEPSGYQEENNTPKSLICIHMHREREFYVSIRLVRKPCKTLSCNVLCRY